LQARGYLLEQREGEYRLVGSHDLLLAERIEPALRGRRFGLPLFSYGRLASTNETAARLAQAEAPEGTLVTAEEQVRGRGRQGRSWHSPPGVGIWMSLVLRPQFDPHRTTCIPLLGALAVADGIAGVTGARPELKWPNDVYLDGRKVAGVLGESAVEGARVRFAVLGMGLNVNLHASGLPEELRATAGSLSMATGRTWDRVEVLAAILAGLEARYEAYVRSGFEAIREEFLASSRLVGRPVDVIFSHGTVSGTVLDVAFDGELVLATAAGTSRVRVGEASLRVI
jgi:BirA family biotin operon repressor/biotin-[acetyl-CoA-carboxylase] ligase